MDEDKKIVIIVLMIMSPIFIYSELDRRACNKTYLLATNTISSDFEILGRGIIIGNDTIFQTYSEFKYSCMKEHIHKIYFLDYYVIGSTKELDKIYAYKVNIKRTSFFPLPKYEWVNQ